MELLTFPVVDDESTPPRWQLDIRDGKPEVSARNTDVSYDIEALTSAQTFIFDDDELAFTYVARGAILVDGDRLEAPALAYFADEEQVALDPLGGALAYVIRIVEL